MERVQRAVHSMDPPKAGHGYAKSLDAPVPPDFDRVYVDYFAEVARWARAFGGPEADLDDVVQETFLVVARKLPEFVGENLRPWLYRITQLVVRDYRRRAWFRRFFSRPDDELDQFEHPGEGPEGAMDRREAQRALQKILNQMPAAQRVVFFLFEVEGYSGVEIAALEQVPLNTVYTRLSTARRRFKELVDEASAAEGGSR